MLTLSAHGSSIIYQQTKYWLGSSRSRGIESNNFMKATSPVTPIRWEIAVQTLSTSKSTSARCSNRTRWSPQHDILCCISRSGLVITRNNTDLISLGSLLTGRSKGRWDLLGGVSWSSSTYTASSVSLSLWRTEASTSERIYAEHYERLVSATRLNMKDSSRWCSRNSLR